VILAVFHNVFDWTAIGTLVLAIVTLVSLFFARSALAKTQAQIELGQKQLAQTQREIELSRREVEEAHRPVLVPFQKAGEGVTYRGGVISGANGPVISENNPARADLPRYSSASLTVENVGVGPALNVRGEFAGPRGKGAAPFPTEAIAVGARGVVVFENREGESLSFTGDDETVEAVIAYDDVAGQTYRTEIVFDIKNSAYRSALVKAEENDRPGD
jgi:hypothetical protein